MELDSIENKYGHIAKNRVVDYENNIQVIKTQNSSIQLSKTNFYLNQLLPQYDDIVQKQEDYWATPKEFLITGYGDCEDYAIIKYFTLINLGFDEKNLFITVVKEKFRGGTHMVLSYFQTKDDSPLVLDNLSFKILSLKQRKDLEADMFINSTGVYKYKNTKLVKIASKYAPYEELLKKVEKEN
ncbi:MAG: transglutaminase-like cysteine peptidase [Sulfurimonas sp.]|nr:transglutaminase-like cysteine peptidase [Sulfurimonas sp.]